MALTVSCKKCWLWYLRNKRRSAGFAAKSWRTSKEGLADYMELAVALVRYYVPPDPTKIQRAKAKDQGKASIHMIDPGRRVSLEFRGCRVSGDALTVEVDLTNNHLAGLKFPAFLVKTMSR